MDGMRATDCTDARLGKPEVLHLAFPDEVLHCSRHVLDRHLRIDTVLIEEVDGIDLQSLERALGDLLDVLWPTIQPQPARFSVGLEFEPELCGNHHPVADGG